MATELVKMRAIALEPPAMMRTLFAGSTYELDAAVVAQLKLQGVIQSDYVVTVVAQAQTAAGDGTAKIQFVITVADKDGNPVAGDVLLATNSPTATIPATATLDATGSATVDVTDNLVGQTDDDTVYVVASIDGSFGGDKATFTVPAMTLALAASPTSTTTGTTSTVTATLTQGGAAVAGATVTFSKDKSTATLDPVSKTTDSAGKATTAVGDSTAETVTITATANGQTKTATVTFTAATPTPVAAPPAPAPEPAPAPTA